jgi:hypothetical protein
MTGERFTFGLKEAVIVGIIAIAIAVAIAIAAS